ncbi:hypothetical protein ACIBK8_00505 [Streptomyces sp. NPDC050161]|uniref:hypothetical protein n=1 Tax=Streptomyces sp. NPDC050161 TaxID=3365604 RepID=UPI0037A8B09B
MSSVHVTFEIPSAFRGTTPGLDAEEARAEVTARAQAQGRELPDGVIEELTAEYRKVSALLAESGVRYSATCFGQFNDEWSMGTLTIGMTPLAYRDTEIAVVGMTKIFAAKHGPNAEVSSLPLPCGLATLVIQQPTALRMPAEFTASGEDVPIDVAQLQAFIPVPQSAVPGAQTLVTVTFSTPSTDHWADYCELLVPFLQSLRFLPDGDATQDGGAHAPAEVPAPLAATGGPALPSFG